MKRIISLGHRGLQRLAAYVLGVQTLWLAFPQGEPKELARHSPPGLGTRTLGAVLGDPRRVASTAAGAPGSRRTGKEPPTRRRPRSAAKRRPGPRGLVLGIALSGWSLACTAETDPASGGSTFAQEVGKEAYETTSPPSTPPLLRWDFSPANVVHTYTYQQETRTQTDLGAAFGENPGPIGHALSVQGVLWIQSQGDHTADLGLRDLTARLTIDQNHKAPPILEQILPPIVVPGMTEAGSSSLSPGVLDLLLEMMFLLPPHALSLGESVEVPAQMPFQAMGSVLPVHGRSRITLKRYVRIGTRPCAQLEVDTEISTLKVPAALEGEYRCSAQGMAVLYFDGEDHGLVSGTIALLQQSRLDVPIPPVKLSGEAVPDLPPRFQMAMTSDSFLRVTRYE